MLLALIIGIVPVLSSQQSDISDGLEVLPNDVNAPARMEVVDLDDADPQSILRTKDDQTLNSMILDTAEWLAPRVNDPSFVTDFIFNGRVCICTRSKDSDNPLKRIVLNITVAVARDPFLITKALITEMWRYYKFINDVKRRPTDIYPVLQSLVEILGNIKSNPDLHKFRSLFRLLSKVFPTNHIFRSQYLLFYYWLYYVEYIWFISAGTLEVMGDIGEGTQAAVFQVGTSPEMSSQQTTFALKIFKERHHGESHTCFKEERVLGLITQHNANQSDEMTGNFEIRAPVLVSKLEGFPLRIRCDPHNSILMEFVAGSPFGQQKQFTTDHAIEMYSQLKPSIEAMASLGISHNDINGNNVMVDRDGMYWFVDFGHSFSLEHHMKRRGNYSFMVGTWFFSSPDLYRFNHFMHKHWGNVTLSDVEDFMIAANLYSLQSLILDRMLSSAGEERETRWRMSKIDSRLNDLYLSNEDALFGSKVKNCLFDLWNIRATSLMEYLLRHCLWRPLIHVFGRLQPEYIERSVQALRDETKRKRIEEETTAKKMK